MSEPRFVLGVDLGTTNTVVAFADLRGARRAEIFPIAQEVSAGVVEARPLLPSMLYAPRAEEGAGDWIVGERARRRGSEVAGRLVASSKSWLAHAAVDRTAAILPWGSAEDDAPDVAKISPIDAGAKILARVRDAWDAAHGDARFLDQSIVLTVPASFDESSRALTVEAARRAGIDVDGGKLHLFEEPQAAFLDGVRVLGDAGLLALLGDGREIEVLVCDVGGGTTDLSLMKCTRDDAAPGGISLTRIAVGDHVLLGGDNMDLALAHRLEPSFGEEKLSPARFAQLVAACRAAKERLFSSDERETTVALLGGGSRLVGGAKKATLTRAMLDEIVLDGFFPVVSREEVGAIRSRRARGGLVAFGLPYASDPAITRHVALFLERHARRDADRPLALLLNGGVFHAAPIRARLSAAIAAFTGHAPSLFPQTDPDLAVARGAVAQGLAMRGIGRKIGGGSARGYYVGLASDRGKHRAVCIVPRGAEPGASYVATGRTFALMVGRAARFELFASSGEAGADADRAGDVATFEDDDERFVALPPVATVIKGPPREIEVELHGALTEIGTLELSCVETATKAAHKLGFELRAQPASSLPPPSMSAPAKEASIAPPSLRSFDKRLDEARAKIDRVFGKPSAEIDPREAKQLTRELEKSLGERSTWPTAIVRPLFDVVVPGAPNRKRGPDHERVFWSLAGFLLRPGFGDPLDPQRVAALEKLYPQGLAFPKEAQSWRAWWIAWRRIAGGLSEATQLAIRDTLDPFLAPDDGRPRKKPKNVRPEPLEEVLLLASSLGNVPASRRTELGAWILERTWTSRDPLLYSAIGRLGARVPPHGSAHHVVSVRTAESWLSHVLRADWSATPTCAFAAVQLARMTGDRARDVSDAIRAEVVKRLEKTGAKEEWIRQVREVVVLDDAQRRELFGEALPIGLRLVED